MKDLGVVDLDAALARSGLHDPEVDADFLLQATELAERATAKGGCDRAPRLPRLR